MLSTTIDDHIMWHLAIVFTKGIQSMSSTITVFAVSLDRIRQVVGSKNESLLTQIVAEQKSCLEDIDSIDEECGFRCAEALADIIHGRVNRDIRGYLYGYAFETLCRQFGRELNEISGIAGAATWIEEIDGALVEVSSPIKLSDLLYAGCPIPIPRPDEYPIIGFLPASILPVTLEQLSTLDTTKLDSDAAEVLGQMTSWLKTAGTIPGASLVSFLS